MKAFFGVLLIAFSQIKINPIQKIEVKEMKKPQKAAS